MKTTIFDFKKEHIFFKIIKESDVSVHSVFFFSTASKVGPDLIAAYLLIIISQSFEFVCLCPKVSHIKKNSAISQN